MADQQDEIYKALADSHRRRIVSALCAEPMVAGELGRLVSLAPNAVSFHLKLLQMAGLVSVQREGRFLRYRINADVLTDWLEHVGQLLAGMPAGDHRKMDAATSVATGSEHRLRQVSSEPPFSSKSDEDAGRLPTELL